MKLKRSILVVPVAVLGLLSLSACGAKPAPSPSATPSQTVSAAILPCLTSQLAWKPGQEGGAAGHIGITAAGFINTSTTTCSLQGYPTLHMLDASGKSIPTFTLHGPSVTVPDIKESLVLLAPESEAFVDLGYSNGTGYGMSTCPTSTSVQITPPANTAALTVDWKLQPFGGPTIQTLRCGEIVTSPVYMSAKL